MKAYKNPSVLVTASVREARYAMRKIESTEVPMRMASRIGSPHPINVRVRTHKRDSLWSSTVIQVLNDGERIGVGTFLADEGAIRGT